MLAGVAAALVLALGPAATARAGGPLVASPTSTFQDPRVSIVPPNDPRLVRPIPNDPRVTIPRTDLVFPQADGGRRDDHHDEGRRHRRVLVVPPTVYIVATPQPPCAGGYWTYQWVPTTYSQSVWVPSQWAPDGRWIEGHYEWSGVSTGTYQPLWVPDPSVC